MKRGIVCFLLFVSIFYGCKVGEKKEEKESVLIFNVADTIERAEFGRLALDETHLNLLNPSISKDSFNVVYKSWAKLHQNVHAYLESNDFDWGIADEKIKIFNRIYFKKDGSIKTYVYRIYNTITEEKAKEYGKLMKEFLKEEQISITRGTDFAQCGKMSLPNSKNQKL